MQPPAVRARQANLPQRWDAVTGWCSAVLVFSSAARISHAKSPSVLLALCLPPLAAHAHDIPNARVDRSIQVSLDPGRLEIDYEVSLSELTLTRDLRMLVGSCPGSTGRTGS